MADQSPSSAHSSSAAHLQFQTLQQPSTVPIPVDPSGPMETMINDTADKLNRLLNDVNEMSNKITYLRDIRPQALQLLARADAAEEEANRLEMERASLEKEVERLKAVVMRMEDMRFSTKQLTDQMMEDTAQQMRHILENGKSIVPRHPSTVRLNIKRSLPEDITAEGPAQVFKIPRRESGEPPNVTGAPAVARPSSTSSSPANKPFSPSRSLSLTPSAITGYPLLSDSTRATQPSYMDIPQLTAASAPNQQSLSLQSIPQQTQPSPPLLTSSTSTPSATGPYSLSSVPQLASSPPHTGYGSGVAPTGFGSFPPNSALYQMTTSSSLASALSSIKTESQSFDESTGDEIGRDVLFR
ncbi:hypothetical protein FRC03_006431 [Tulasnella sp. 419]|nr:hypothetical protein FRC03_006431 [Tulasnella sp. 419]